MSTQIIEGLVVVRRVNKLGRMYYISIPPPIGKHLYKKNVIVRISVLPEEKEM